MSSSTMKRSVTTHPNPSGEEGGGASLKRFLEAQEGKGYHTAYKTALAELKKGAKRTCWIWYVFPQFNGTRISANNQLFQIHDPAECVAFLDHPTLGPRYMEAVSVVVTQVTKNHLPLLIVLGGTIDATKFYESTSTFLLGAIERYAKNQITSRNVEKESTSPSEPRLCEKESSGNSNSEVSGNTALQNNGKELKRTVSLLYTAVNLAASILAPKSNGSRSTGSGKGGILAKFASKVKEPTVFPPFPLSASQLSSELFAMYIELRGGMSHLETLVQLSDGTIGPIGAPPPPLTPGTGSTCSCSAGTRHHHEEGGERCEQMKLKGSSEEPKADVLDTDTSSRATKKVPDLAVPTLLYPIAPLMFERWVAKFAPPSSH